MIDPFSAWMQIVSAGFEMQRTWLRSVETAQASHAVIGARSAKLHGAVVAPMTADHAEFARMIPEKVEAFGRSAAAVARETAAMHFAWTRQMQRVGTMMLAGRPPTLVEAVLLVTRSTDFALGTMAATARLGAGAIGPVHRAATGNARRLGRKERR